MGLVFGTQGQVTPKRIVRFVRKSNSSETNPCFCHRVENISPIRMSLCFDCHENISATPVMLQINFDQN